ncbi:hypothetical protein MSAN_01303500 [Mycena sanguinolenta]|uniref:Uncharacterized protein n=1 Tax=Mycena sanguinolenta TaxID=230812 RepID=A0A8H6YF14_9AGAR|nr:hypothetical protein MSAN_01303500 [Mycena sanguinolenta]
MDVSLEAYRNIVRSVARRSDIASLCGVNRAFRNAAERALYNTLIFSDEDPRLCTTLATSPRIASLVIALTVQVRRRQDGGRETSDSDSGSAASEGSARASASASASGSVVEGSAFAHPTSDQYWAAVAGALRNTTRLRHLTIDISDPVDCASAWVLDGCTFQLHTFHCDFDWDHALCGFLATQRHLYDLSLRDYREPESPHPASEAHNLVLSTVPDDPNSGSTSTHGATDVPPVESPPHTLEEAIPLETVTPKSTTSLVIPALTTLECTFSEAAVMLVPGRPLSRLKTCFSRSDSVGKRAELVALFGALRRSRVALRALDLADVSYTESGAMELLHRIAHTQITSSELRYLGTLALPIGGRKRLHFYGLLMRLPQLRCIEVDVSAWSPPPTSSPALRALAAELRLYCHDVHTVVFVQEFERTVVTAGGTGVLKIDDEANPELFWREM